MTNEEVAKILRNVAACYSLSGENIFKTIAYERASDFILKMPEDIEDVWKEGKLNALPGIGKTIALHLDELFKTGRSEHFEKIFSGYPDSLFVLLDIPGFGPKKALRVIKELNLEPSDNILKDLLRMAESGKIALLPGFGDKSEEQIVQAIKKASGGFKKEQRIYLPKAIFISGMLEHYMKQNSESLKISTLGSLRRMNETIGDIDMAVATENPVYVIDWFTRFEKAIKVIERGSTGASILLNNGIHADLRVIHPDMWGSMLQYFTGSREHNIKLREYALKIGLSLSEYGIKPVGPEKEKYVNMKNYDREKGLLKYDLEDKFYNAIGLQFIPPEIREGTNEITLSSKGKIPRLIELKDISGDLHIHSSYQINSSHDIGGSGLNDLIAEADRLGYEYIGLSDHNPAFTTLTEEKIIEIMRKRNNFFEHFMLSNKYTRVKLFIMCEIDINPDGQLSLPAKALDFIDAAIVSVHSSFGMRKKEMTDRIISGLKHTKAKILGHPTGRIIGQRSGYDLDWERILRFARENDKALEINAYPERLDINSMVVQRAVENGVKLVINTDSHLSSHMEYMHYGVSVARKGWARKENVINSWGYDKMKRWLWNRS